MLYSSSGSDSGSNSDIFRTAVIDTIVAEVQSTPGEDRCVLLLGYKAQMEVFFQASFVSLVSQLHGILTP